MEAEASWDQLEAVSLLAGERKGSLDDLDGSIFYSVHGSP